MIDICCVRSGVKYHTMSYWSIVMKSPVNFVPNKYEKSFKMDNQPEKKYRTFRKSLLTCVGIQRFLITSLAPGGTTHDQIQ